MRLDIYHKTFFCDLADGVKLVLKPLGSRKNQKLMEWADFLMGYSMFKMIKQVNTAFIQHVINT